MTQTKPIVNPTYQKTIQILSLLVLSFLILLLMVQAVNSLHWRMEQDTPLMHYAAFLMDKYDLVPYRDFFETSMPGTFAFHYLVGTLFGYGDLAFHIVDLVLLAILLVVTYTFMAQFGKLTAAWGIVIFALVYFSKGQTITLQRDYLGLLPISLCLLFIPHKSGEKVKIISFTVVGFLFGCAALFKPHLSIGLPAFFWVLLMFSRIPGRVRFLDVLKKISFCAVGFVLPIAIALFWLAGHQALLPFLDIFFNYLPLHTSLNGLHESLTNTDRLIYLLKNTVRLGGYAGFAVCFIVVLVWLIKFKPERDEIKLSAWFLVVCVVLFGIYPSLAGKFWSYHYMPFAFFISLVTSLCGYIWHSRQPQQIAVQRCWSIPILLMVVAIAVELKLPSYASSVIEDIRTGYSNHVVKDGRVDEMAAWLELWLQPGDTVQPLDWTGGSIHAMLLSEAKLATRFMYDYHFYHSISTNYVQELRKEFIQELKIAQPIYIIQVDSHKPWVSGVDTTRSFPELEALLINDYQVVHTGDGYLIYERIDV